MDDAKPDPGFRERSERLSRKSFLERLGWFGLGLIALAGIPGTIRFLKPVRRAGGRGAFDAGTLQEYEQLDVSSRWLKRHGLWIVREHGQLVALDSRCTHLGCTPRWESAKRMFRCPCHGSLFSIEGVALKGPAVDPLRRVAIWTEGGRVMIDPTKRVSLEEAERTAEYHVDL